MNCNKNNTYIYVFQTSLETWGVGCALRGVEGAVREQRATLANVASEGQDGLVDDLHRLPDLVLLDHQWGRQPDDVAMGGLG